MHRNGQKNVNEFHLSVCFRQLWFDYNMFAMSCLGMSMNSRIDWLQSVAELHRYCYQRMKKASACLCSHKGPIFRIFTEISWTTYKLLKANAYRCYYMV